MELLPNKGSGSPIVENDEVLKGFTSLSYMSWRSSSLQWESLPHESRPHDVALAGLASPSPRSRRPPTPDVWRASPAADIEAPSTEILRGILRRHWWGSQNHAPSYRSRASTSVFSHSRLLASIDASSGIRSRHDR